MKYLVILIGSGTGGLTRYLLSKWVYSLSNGSFPIGTLVVNLSGCFIIGFLTGLFEHWIISPNMRLLIFVGFLGGFTTFSTFGLETFNLLKEAEIRLALTNFLFSGVFGVGLVFAGYVVSQLILKAVK